MSNASQAEPPIQSVATAANTKAIATQCQTRMESRIGWR
jgi:hypothetical protein